MADKRIRIILDSKGAKRNADELNKSVRGVGDSANSAQFSVNKLAAAITGAISTQKVIEYADAWTRVQNQLKQATNSQEELAQSTNRILQISIDTRTNLEETANLYSRFRNAIDETVLSDERLFKITETINKSLAVSGATATESAGALRQLSQAIASGVLRGEEFNSISEQAPSILKAVQVQTGKTAGELRKLAADGFITSELLVKSLENYASTINNQFSKATATFGQRLEVARTQTIAFVGANETIAGAVDLAGSSIVTLSENLELLLEIAGAGAALYVARLIPSVIAYTGAIVASTAAQVASRPAVTGLSAALGVQAGALTAARVQANLMTVAAGALRGALAFLGGPAGVVFLAAAALIYFGSRAKEAIDPTSLLTQSVEGLTNAQRELIKLNINKAFDEQITIIEDAAKKVKFLEDTLTRGTVKSKEGIKAANDELVIQSARLDEARIAAEKLTQKLAEVIKPASAPKRTEETPVDVKAKGFDPFDDLQDALDKENANIRVIESAKNVTKSLEQELALRRTIADIYRSNELGADASFYEKQLAQIQIREAEERAIAQAKFSEEAAQREERLAATLENDKLTDEARKALKAEFDAQELLATQILEQEKTAIQEEATKARMELDRAEWEARLNNAGALGNALISLGQGQSKKIFKIGQTLALAQAAVALPTAVMESFKNGGGYPWGLIPAGIMLATGLKNIQNIRSAGAGLGGGGGSVPTPSLGSATGTTGQPSIPSTASTQQVEQRRVYELRGVAGNDKITVDQFRELMEQDGAVVVLSDSVNDASRRNVTGVTAR